MLKLGLSYEGEHLPVVYFLLRFRGQGEAVPERFAGLCWGLSNSASGPEASRHGRGYWGMHVRGLNGFHLGRTGPERSKQRSIVLSRYAAARRRCRIVGGDPVLKETAPPDWRIVGPPPYRTSTSFWLSVYDPVSMRQM